MSEANGKSLKRRQILALRGLRLPWLALKSLRDSGILCEPAISIQWQKVPDTYVLRGRESGGAVGQIGVYCGFAQENGELLEWIERLDQIARNGLHALALAPRLVRVQAFRNQRSYDLLITRHRLQPRAGRRRPLLESGIVFHGVRGTLPSSINPDSNPENRPLPAFDDGFGKPVMVPLKFEPIARLAIAGTECVGCTHAHVLRQRTTA